MRWTAGACNLTGFSDGGIFTYVLGLAYADIFAGIAPVAGRIHPAINHLLRRGQGKDLPIFIVHADRTRSLPSMSPDRRTMD